MNGNLNDQHMMFSWLFNHQWCTTREYSNRSCIGMRRLGHDNFFVSRATGLTRCDGRRTARFHRKMRTLSCIGLYDGCVEKQADSLLEYQHPDVSKVAKRSRTNSSQIGERKTIAVYLMNVPIRRESSTHGVRRRRMRLLTILIYVSFLTLLDGSIYLYNSEDSAAVEMYDCLYYQSTLYCLRPYEPVALERDNGSNQCYANGTNHSFQSIRSNNISVHTVLHQWRSSLDKAEEYAKYLRQPMDSNDAKKSLCECLDPQSFGKNCEYRLPLGSSFTELVMEKFSKKSSKLMYVGDIVCYTTLTCDSGLLCLDWRDICDGTQHCMYGYDEENCDKLEFNECDDDEYRCMNGMCIPDEYFLDGE